MIIAGIILIYAIGVFLLIRFLQAIHGWDEEIEEMVTKPLKEREYA